jgi:hypothetical protein
MARSSDQGASRRFLLIEARDRDEAVEIASRVPILQYGPIEVRPIYVVPGSTDAT